MAHNTPAPAEQNAPPVTRILADFVATHPTQDWNPGVEREAHRTLQNWVGCAIGASRHATVEAALAAVRELEPSAQATILGRAERVDCASAAPLNGITSHTFDYDDTHLRTIIHPAGPLAAAARAGLTSALLARHGYTASIRALEAPRGLLQTYSASCDWSEITVGLGQRFEIASNTYKPFACGIVIHPSIDGCVQLAAAHGLCAGDIERIELKVHPLVLVLELTGKTAPRNGLEAKFSVYHAAAAGILFGKAGEAEFADGVVARAENLIGQCAALATCADVRSFAAQTRPA